MRSQAILTLLSAATASAQFSFPGSGSGNGNSPSPQFGAVPTTGKLGDAVIEQSPAGAVYIATLPEEPFTSTDVGGNVKGSITAMTRPDGQGVLFTVIFANIPRTGGPFGYHIHVDAVPDDGNCTKTLAHLDPFERGEDPACDSSAPESCQVGDLSGKYGKIPEGNDTFIATFSDPYVSLSEGPGAFFGNRSFVFHYANKTRITCANFEPVSLPVGTSDDCDASATGSSNPSSSSQEPSRSNVPQNGATVTGISSLAALAAIIFAL